MKTLKFFVVLALFVSATFNILADTASDCYIHRKTTDKETGWWDWKELKNCCEDNGVNCIKEKCNKAAQGLIHSTTGGYLLTLTLDEVNFSVLENGTWTPKTNNGKNYTFLNIDFITIDDCPAYPALNNRIICLQGITTDANGQYTVFIPSGNY